MIALPVLFALITPLEDTLTINSLEEIRNLSYNKRAETGINAEIFYKIVYIIKQ